MDRKGLRHTLIGCFWALTLLLQIIMPSFSVQAATTQSKQSSLPKLKVSGSKLVDESNKQVILKGFSCATSTRISSDWPNWYTDKTFKTIKSWGANVFRVTLKPEQYVEDPKCAQLLYGYIDMCIANDLYVLITWMGNEDYQNYSEQAKSFFDSMSKRYKGCNNVIYEVCNEPFHSPWTAIRSYADSIIKVIRANSPDAVIAVPTAYHILQSDDSMISVLNNPLNYKNIVYSYHMYVGSSLHSSTLDSIDTLLNNNYPVLITEWGATLSNGQDGFFKDKSITWLRFLDSRNIGWINFNLSDVYWNNTPYNSSVAKMGQWNSDLNDSILSESGYLVKHYLLGDYKNSSGSHELMEVKSGYAFWNDDIKKSVTSVVFNKNGFASSKVIKSWDCSLVSGTGMVTAYICSGANGNTLYIIPSSGTLIAPTSMESFFEGFENVKTIDFTGLDTSCTVSAKKMFYNCLSLETIKWGQNMFANVVNWSEAFEMCRSLKQIDLTRINMRNTTNINLMFSWCSSLEKLTLPYLEECKLNERVDVFYKCGIDSASLTISVASKNKGFVDSLIKNSTEPNSKYKLVSY
ncbi:glycoside hydrolase family 5 protein [Butyrivibrio sp. VCB2001]|uniref:glycoside hydrolase family 5 protein n=1 Tax=Butyrivibrio sp. VCB2001 TaxID=1280667 RepID=UPI0004091680|nr:glycoside hydrolase family 5 protein [Butyrivibrio sp. VCB2001]